MRRVIEKPGELGCTPKQRHVLDDFDSGSKYISVRCPRRSGKSYIMALLATYVGESKPGSRILVISLTLKSTKENYWSGSPSGIFTMDRAYNLGLKYNHTDNVWWHQNGSRGRLAGAETRADIEYLRGAAAEADVVILDECKSFAPGLLTELIREVLEPGLMTRNGVIVMGGTPGLIPLGPFFEATSETSKLAVEYEGEKLAVPTCVPYERRTEPLYVQAFEKYNALLRKMEASDDAPDEEDVAAADEPWSLHMWTVRDNTAAPGQWARALRIKRRAKWQNDHPTWRREYLGEWAHDGDGLVYAFAKLKETGKVTWVPEPSKTNKTGLPPEEGPWHLVFGLDLGFVDDTALVVAAYSERVAELRHVWDHKEPHLIPEKVVELIQDAIARFGQPVAIVGDAGNLGKMLIEGFNQTYGIPIVKAEKVEKNDHIELLNGDFHTGRVKIIPSSDLDHELCGLQWDLSQASMQELIRTGKLKEDKRLPNHLTDALLYLHRYSYHNFAQREVLGPEVGSTAWYEAQEKKAEEKAALGVGQRKFATDGYPGLDKRPPVTREVVRWEAALAHLRPN